MIAETMDYIKGYLRICVYGLSAERFMNACRYRGIELHHVSCLSGQYYMDISLKDFKNIRPVVRKTKVKIKIVKRIGIPFLLKKLKKRYFFIIGLCFFILFNIWSSGFVWHIEIEGNQTETSEEIIDFLNTQKICTGMKRKKVNCTYIEKEIRKRFSDIIWVSASMKGTCLYIQVKENEDSFQNESTQKNAPSNIIADCDAQIESMIVRNGVSCINPGDNVRKGELLISGNVPVFNDEKEIIKYQPRDADADIIGITTISYQDSLSNYKITKKYDDIIREIYTFHFGKYSFTIGSKEYKYKEFEKRSILKSFYINNELKIPVSIRAIQIKPYTSIKKKCLENEIQLILTERYQRYIKELEKKGVEIIRNNVKIYRGINTTTANGTITIKRNIGIKQKTVLKTGE